MQNKHMEIILYRHNRLNTHLHKIGLHNSGLCEFSEEPERVKHYYWIATFPRKLTSQ